MRAIAVLIVLMTSAVFLAGVCIGEEEVDEEEASAPEMNMTEMDTPQMNIYETIEADGNFTTLVTAIQEAELVETLQGPGPFTMCTPTDEAFAMMPQGELEALLADKGNLTEVLTYHIIPGAKVMSSDLVDGMTAGTIQGSNLTFDINETSIMVDGATVLEPDIEASNGVIYHIDNVMIPPM